MEHSVKRPFAETSDRVSVWEEEQGRLLIERRKARSLDQLILRAGSGFQNASLGRFELSLDSDVEKRQQSILAAIGGLGLGAGLIIYGPQQTGKTWLMVAAAKRAIELGTEVVWVNGPEVFWSSDFRDIETLDSFVNAPVLAIDQLANPAGSLPAHQKTRLLSLLEGRQRNQRPTWTTMSILSRAEGNTAIGETAFNILTRDTVRLFCDWPPFNRKGI